MHGHWTQGDELLATAIEVLCAKLDLVAALQNGLVRMWAKNDPGPIKSVPVEIRRPRAIEKLRAEQSVRKPSSTSEVIAFFRRAASNVA